MDNVLFASVIRNLLHIEVFSVQKEDAAPVLQDYEKRYCYNKVLQPLYTAEKLERLLDPSSMQENVLYETKDRIGTCACLFRAQDQTFLLSPYVSGSFNETKVTDALMEAHIPASYVKSIQLYYSGFPMASSVNIHHALIACLHAFTQTAADITIQEVENIRQSPSPAGLENYTQMIDYSTLRQHYAMENRFLSMIEMGDTENVVIAFQEMNTSGMGKARYINALYHDPLVGLSMTRAMARKAAEHGGADIVEINEITQRAAQKTYNARNVHEQIAITHDMLLELTQAVRNHRLRLGTYSAPIRDVATFLRHNYSQNVSMQELSHVAGLSESTLSRTFHKETGMTIPQYIAKIRCAEAAQLLARTTHNIQDISAYVGYEDSNYFVKVFRRQYGQTPSAYRAAKS